MSQIQALHNGKQMFPSIFSHVNKAAIMKSPKARRYIIDNAPTFQQVVDESRAIKAEVEEGGWTDELVKRHDRFHDRAMRIVDEINELCETSTFMNP